MHSAFWFGYELKDFLFKGLIIDSVSGLVLLCLALIGLAIAFEGLKVLHAEIKIRTVLLRPQVRASLFSPHDSTTLLEEIPENIKRRQAVCYLMEISLYLIQVILGYLLMLSVMTYNGYVSLAILLGVALGYTLFGRILIERRIKNTQLTMPCQQCLQSEGRSSTEVTVLNDDASFSGCCARTPENTNVSEIMD